MTRALTPAEIRAAFTHWHVPAIYVDGWETRSNQSGFGDVTGFMAHHTANDVDDLVDRRVVTFGRETLPGPLCNFGGRDDGKVDVIAAGAANHAGGGDPDVLLAVQRESYGDYPPPTDKHHGEDGSVIGNPRFYGYETYYGAATEPKMENIQFRCLILVNTAIIWALDKIDTANTWTSKSSIAHKEWSDWKVDPFNVDMAFYRSRVQWCLDVGPDAAYQWYLTGETEEDMGTVTDITPEVLGKIRMAVIQSKDSYGETLIGRIAVVRDLIIKLGQDLDVDLSSLLAELNEQQASLEAVVRSAVSAALAGVDIHADVDADALTEKILDGLAGRVAS